MDTSLAAKRYIIAIYFVDTWVSDLTVTGIVLAFKKYLDDQTELKSFAAEDEEFNKKQ